MSEEREPMSSIEEANYIKLDGRVFSITPIANQEMNLEAELKQYYNEKYARHIDLFNNGIVTGLTDDWRGQLDKLHQRAQQNSVTIPRNLYGQYVVCIDGREVEQVKCIIYSPNVFKMTRSDIASALDIAVTVERDEDRNIVSRHYPEGKVKHGKHEFDLNSVRDDKVIFVKVKQRIFFPAMYSFNARSNRLHCLNVNTFHNQSESICTGGHQASAFWNSGEFEELMNQTNCFSLGSRQVYLKQPDSRKFAIKDFVKRSTIISIQEERAGEWKT